MEERWEDIFSSKLFHHSVCSVKEGYVRLYIVQFEISI